MMTDQEDLEMAIGMIKNTIETTGRMEASTTHWYLFFQPLNSILICSTFIRFGSLIAKL